MQFIHFQQPLFTQSLKESDLKTEGAVAACRQKKELPCTVKLNVKQLSPIPVAF